MTGNPGVHGLFIGAGEVCVPGAPPARHAAADAIALHALFADTIGDQAALLCDRDATSEAVTEHLARLTRISGPDDTVVFTFSGHGTRDRRLVTHDTGEAYAGLPIDDVVEALRAVPARVLLVALDCCFSGMPSARDLSVPAPSRRGTQPDKSGRGWVVLTAATAEQEARAPVEHGHGLLTYHLLAGLSGAPEVLDGDRIGLTRLVDYVRRQVGGTRSATDARRQDTTARTGIEGNPTLPVLRPGARYRAAHGAHQPIAATAAPSSLVRHGVPEPVAAMWAREVGHLNRLQLRAINEAQVLAGGSAAVSAPTASGKTAIGRIVADRVVADGGRAVFLLPTRALVAELYEHLTRTRTPLGTRIIRVTGEHTDQLADLVTGEHDIAVLTYEMFTGLLLKHPRLLTATRLLVVDEIHNIASATRGPGLELALMLVRLHQIDHGGPQVIGLSAAPGGFGDLETWLRATPVVSDLRPVPLLEGVLTPDGEFRHLGPDRIETVDHLPGAAGQDTRMVALLRHLIADAGQILVFCSTKRATRSCAATVGAALDLPPANRTLADLPDDDLGYVGEQLRARLRQGVAFHTAELSQDERRAVEIGFRDHRDVRVLVTTTTLAQGVNLPAGTVVVDGLEHPDGTPYSVIEYKNIAGRAGRTGLAERGRSVILARSAADARMKWATYVRGTGPPLRSALRLPGADIRRWVLHACAGRLVSGHRPTGADVTGFLRWSFAAHQCRMTDEPDPFPPEVVEQALTDLTAYDMVRPVASGHTLTPLGEVAVEHHLDPESVAMIADVLAEMGNDDINGATLIGVAQLTAELDQVRFVADATEDVALSQALKRQRLAPVVLDRFGSGRARAGRAKRVVACLAWSRGAPLSTVEQALGGSVRHDPVPVRRAADRTADVLPAVVGVARLLHPVPKLAALGALLPRQLRLGVVDGLVAVASRTSAEVGRGTFCALTAAGVNSPAAIVAASDALLLSCTGGDQGQLGELRAAAVREKQEQPDLAALLAEPSNDHP
ncbi:putative ski2-type helicase [Actinokineospora spheciospongiae]|uniref:Putative ski2-type helicase n=1 Tax=Actinokineospora spheciospongiae TaxID=909613 RepID=W7IT81_9PSEU|nr:DEAD/DEAH box helicase [Actinokineospora spheciospongiae]EWC64095.1 putative ski2-type helicase [Actinokineospora spheciospongiae]